jgi:hypothetical protein
MKICGGKIPIETTLIADIEIISYGKTIVDNCLDSLIYFIEKPINLTLESATVSQAGSSMMVDLEATNITLGNDFEGIVSLEVIPNATIQESVTFNGNVFLDGIPSSTLLLDISYDGLISVGIGTNADVEIVTNTQKNIIADFVISPFIPPTRDQVNFTLIPSNQVFFNFEGSIGLDIIPTSNLTITLSFNNQSVTVEGSPQSVANYLLSHNGLLIVSDSIDSLVEFIQNISLFEYTGQTVSGILPQSLISKIVSMNGWVEEIITPTSLIFHVGIVSTQYEHIYFEITRSQDINTKITRSIDINLAV